MITQKNNNITKNDKEVRVMTFKEKITEALNCNSDAEIDRLIRCAYWMGEHHATVVTSDAYRDHIAAQKKRAAECRYYMMAAEVVGRADWLYMPDYSSDYADVYAADEYTLED